MLHLCSAAFSLSQLCSASLCFFFSSYQGFLSLSQARKVMGVTSVSSLQYPSTMTASTRAILQRTAEEQKGTARSGGLPALTPVQVSYRIISLSPSVPYARSFTALFSVSLNFSFDSHTA